MRFRNFVFFKYFPIFTLYLFSCYQLFFQKYLLTQPVFELVEKGNKTNKVNEKKIQTKNSFKSQTTLLKSRSFVQIKGPKVTLNVSNAPSREILVYLARLGGYGYVFLNNENQSNFQSSTIDSKITISLFQESFETAFNNVLMASGLKAKLEGNNLFIGKSISSREYSSQISKLFYLKQASAASAADYLASLGAAISKVSTSSVSSTTPPGPGSTAGEELSRKQSIVTNVETYGSSVGPLVGITGTTDSRLQTITLVGEPKLIAIAEEYLKQIDIRQKQVALKVKVLDVNLLDGDIYENSFALRQDAIFIVNESGRLLSNFGQKKPPSNESAGLPGKFNASGTVSQFSAAGLDPIDPTNEFTIYPKNSFYDFLSARITSSETNVLASPTLILSENQDSTSSGGTKIGRSFSNEGLVRVGNQVVSSYKLTTDDNGNVFCEPQFSTAGISLAAKLMKIDNDGFITFVIEPTLSAAVGQESQGGCGTINTVNERILESGAIRVKNKHTLILTGVLSDTDIEVINKWPLFGDIPVIGNLFKTKANSKEKRELVILVTPTIIEDNNYSSSYYPQTINIKENLVK